MVGITYGIEPYGDHAMGWTNPRVIGELVGGVLLLVAFGFVELRVAEPMFRLQLFKIRAFTAGVFASFLAAISRGGLMFLLIIWLQGIWLPLHGYSFATTPLWAGIALIPLTVGMLIAGPVSGFLSDRFGARPFATGGMIGAAIGFALLEALPIDFDYWVFGLLLFFTGLAMASFGSPNRTGVMNSLPPEHRGAGSGMNTTFQNSAQVISIGIFFSLMILGLASALPHNVSTGLLDHGVSAPVAARAAHLPPISTLFAAFLGYDPVPPDRPERHGAPQRDAASRVGPTQLLPEPDRRPFPQGPRRRPRLRHPGQPRRRGRCRGAGAGARSAPRAPGRRRPNSC